LGIRHTRLVAMEQGSCTSVVLFAALSPEGATHFPELTATTLKVLPPLTGASRNCWFVPEWHAYCITAALSLTDAPEMSRQLPAVNVATE
jgi:hypothetical protein